MLFRIINVLYFEFSNNNVIAVVEFQNKYQSTDTLSIIIKFFQFEYNIHLFQTDSEL